MSEAFALAAFLARWSPLVRHDLAASHSEPLPLSWLLAAADAEDRRRWEALDLGYAHPQGAPWLRAAIAQRYRGLTADDVLCCAGAQESMSCLLRAVLGPNDHAVMVLPLYGPTETAVTTVCAATGVALSDDGAWSLDIDRLAAVLRPNTKLILTNIPNSPTGASLQTAARDALVSLCRRHGLWLVNDEVYRETDVECLPPIADAYERGVSIDGLSKGFGLPGLRVGWIACRERDLLARTLVIKSGLSSCLSSASEVLAHIALRNRHWIVARTRDIGRRNRILLDALLARHAALFDPDGERNLAFAFPRYRGVDAEAFAVDLACRGGLLVLPSTLWHSPLARLPADRLRISLGHASVAPALEALDSYLAECGR
ncbi:pyridoxal phosphate-dependent aminotransferase [Methylobacterium segetis]|uniref:pyridoxal phosphate-dependent aminotransferase n=1 Tax=Methylobacterium segetis TaxID=2488750 RepID=UPI0010439B24|nr:pyridoxal phosphate-dependent aminotransferase [Methylobacterium segetis]